VLLVAILLAVSGVAAIVFTIVALRDDPPRWMLKVKHPGWFAVFGVLALAAALFVNSSRRDVFDDITEYVGQPIRCESLGDLAVRGGSHEVYSCTAADDGMNLGCLASVDGQIVDVSMEARALGEAC
jgi:hypothetical protein